MKRKLIFMCAGAFALASMAGSAMAVNIPGAADLTCADKLQNETLLYVNAVQKQIRLSIKNNTKGHDSKCSGGFSCAGGGSNGGACDPSQANTQCPGGQCVANGTKGIAGAINKAKGKMRNKFAQFCPAGANFTNLGYPNSRCTDTSPTADTVADCVLEGAIGDIANGVFGDPAGEILARAANDIVPDSPVAPNQICGVTLGSILGIGSESSDATVAEAGGPTPGNMALNAGSVYDTSSQGVIGNNLTAPTQTFAGLIPICLVTTTGNAGNGTPGVGQINISTGQQSNFSPISSKVLIGTTCPVCDAGSLTCDSGANSGQPCSAAGSTDTACPPTIAGSPPIVPNPLNLSTENTTLAVPANNPGAGATNPSGTFCGACDLDDTIGCNNDSVCITNGACSGGVGSGCCQFGTNTGAFGNDGATTAVAVGIRGPYIPKLATIFCTGKSGSGLVDGTQGLPGPVRLVQEQLNAFQYPP